MPGTSVYWVGCCSGGRAGRPVRVKKHFISIMIVIIGLIVNVIHDYPNLPSNNQPQERRLIGGFALKTRLLYSSDRE